jgi:hypothetical protein
MVEKFDLRQDFRCPSARGASGLHGTGGPAQAGRVLFLEPNPAGAQGGVDTVAGRRLGFRLGLQSGDFVFNSEFLAFKFRDM